jgi:hypothetical protein
VEPHDPIVNVESVGPLAKVHGDDRMPRHTRLWPSRWLSVAGGDPSKAVRHGRARPIWNGGNEIVAENVVSWAKGCHGETQSVSRMLHSSTSRKSHRLRSSGLGRRA